MTLHSQCSSGLWLIALVERELSQHVLGHTLKNLWIYIPTLLSTKTCIHKIIVKGWWRQWGLLAALSVLQVIIHIILRSATITSIPDLRIIQFYVTWQSGSSDRLLLGIGLGWTCILHLVPGDTSQETVSVLTSTWPYSHNVEHINKQPSTHSTLEANEVSEESCQIVSDARW